MKKLLWALLLGSTALLGAPSDAALNKALKALGSEETIQEIAPLQNIRDDYKTGYISLYKRYQETRERHANIEGQFIEVGIPAFFALIPYCESKFNPEARGNGVAGLWQFAAQSGRTYGLCIEKGNDERLNTERSTKAAIKYIKDLHRIFGSWYLADFAYGMGELKLQRLIRDNHSKKISVLMKDPRFPRGTKAHFAKTLLLDAKIHHSKSEESSD